MDGMKNYKCPCCGDSLVFDAKSQQLHCESCENDFSFDVIVQMEDADQHSSGPSKYEWDQYEPREFEPVEGNQLLSYGCTACGAELTGDDTMGATVCPYCGSATVVKGIFEGALKPDYLIPFKVDKKMAIAALEADFKNAPFLPDVFKNKKRIAEMTGVYVPFWMFDCDCEADVTYNAQRTTAWSDANYDYVKTDHYKLFRSGKIGFANIPVDGAMKIDNAYMEAIEPFDYGDAVEFDSAYLSGYMADKYDVTAEQSVARANERVKNSTMRAFQDTTERYSVVVPEKVRVDFSGGKIRYALLPVWMLNIKYNEKLYPFAVNGQTGKVVGEYSVDHSKKWRYFAKVAAIGYAIAAVLAFVILM